MNTKRTNASWLLALICAALLGHAGRATAQGSLGPVVVLRTGAGGPLISSTQAIGNITASGPVFLQFAFGFSTDEQAAPGVFFDSLTLTLAEENGPLSVIYNTTDRNGIVWAPLTPSTIFLSPDSITRQAIPFPSLSPNHTNQFAYLVTAPVPNELLGRNLNFYVDLFDNQNGVNSLGWISAVTVPEPGTWALAAVALILFFGFKWRTE